jgi:hypothetical protein
MDVGGDTAGIVERAGADESKPRMAVFAEDRDLAGRAAEDPLAAAVITRNVHGLRVACQQRYPVGFDQQVDHEGAAGLPLAVQAVATVDEQRIRGKPVANLSAGAAAFTFGAHDLLA